MPRVEGALRPPGRTAVDLVLGIDPARPEPLHRQLYSGLRAAILDQRLKPGVRLPSTRALSTTLGLARNTVHGAYDQLLAEGNVETRHGAGTYVATSLPDEALQAATEPGAPSPGRGIADGSPDGGGNPSAAPSAIVAQSLSRWGRRIAEIDPTPYMLSAPDIPFDFRHGRPDATHFPLDAW